jgi:hypothetical protein
MAEPQPSKLVMRVRSPSPALTGSHPRVSGRVDPAAAERLLPIELRRLEEGLRNDVIRLGQTIPALPVRDAGAAVAFYRKRLGFEVLHHDGGFAVLRRDDAVLHLWEASDDSWPGRDVRARPVTSGAESFLAGTPSCRIHLEGVADLY